MVTGNLSNQFNSVNNFRNPVRSQKHNFSLIYFLCCSLIGFFLAKQLYDDPYANREIEL